MVDLEKEMEKLKKLPPKERVEKIKELKEQHEADKKKQEKKVEDIIEASLHEIEINEKIKRIEIENENQDMDDMVSDEQLEEQLKAAKSNQDYASKINQILPQGAQEEIKHWYQQETRTPEKGEFLDMYNNAKEAYDTLKQNMEQSQAGNYQTESDKAVEGLVESMRLMRKMGYNNGWFT